MTVWPTGESKPLVSTLNALTGTITANAAIVPSGLSGAISVYPSSATDLVIDIDGYFAPADSAPDPLSLYTLAPCRVLDTRQTTGAFRGTLPVSVLQSGCQVPSAQAYVLNATVVPQHGQPLGYLTLWPDAEDKPLVSTLNALDGAITSNMAIVSTLNGFIDAYATSPTDLVVDIFSYFAPIAPLSITTTSLPSASLNYNYSTTLGASGGVTPYAWSITSGILPPGLNLDPTSGVISGTPTMTGTYPFTLQVSDSQTPPATASAPLSITVNATLTQLSIVTTSLPSGAQNQTYSAMLAATGGLTPYTWSISVGSLPAGLSLNSSTGAITGTPTGGGTSTFTVQVTDANTPPATATAQLSITITVVPLRITTASLPYGIFGTPYSAMLTATGGVYPYTWSITAGSLPAGLSLNGSTGAITGTPTGGGTSIFTVQVADSESPPQTATAQLSISIAHGIIISSLSPNTLFCDLNLCLTTPPETFDGLGFTKDTLIFGSGYPGGIPLGDGVLPDQYVAAINISGSYYRPRFIDFWMTSADGTLNSNVVTLAFFGSAPLGAISANNIFVSNPADGSIHKFNMDGLFLTSFNSGAGRFEDNGIAVDDFTGTVKVVSAGNQGIGWVGENGELGGGTPGDGAYVFGLTVADNVACTTEPIPLPSNNNGNGWCTSLVTGQGVAHFYAAGAQPHAQGKAPASSACGESDVFTFDAQGLTTGPVIGPALYKHFVASDGTATLRGSPLALSEFTPASAFGWKTQYVANWSVVVLPSCKVGVTGPVLNPDGTTKYVLSIVDGTSMQEVVSGGVALPANAWKVFADQVNGNFIASSVDLTGSQGVNDLTKIDPLGNSTPLSSNSSILGTGAGVKPDGTIYFAGWDPLNDTPAPQVWTLPNN